MSATRPYTGTTAFGFGISSKPPVKLKVTASGAWTIKISTISTAPTLLGSARPARTWGAHPSDDRVLADVHPSASLHH